MLVSVRYIVEWWASCRKSQRYACVRMRARTLYHKDKLNGKACKAKTKKFIFFLIFMMTNRAMVRHYTEILYSLYNLK